MLLVEHGIYCLDGGFGDWKDIFVAWAPTKNVSLTLAYVDLGVVVPATTASRKQQGVYLSAQLAF